MVNENADVFLTTTWAELQSQKSVQRAATLAAPNAGIATQARKQLLSP